VSHFTYYFAECHHAECHGDKERAQSWTNSSWQDKNRLVKTPQLIRDRNYQLPRYEDSLKWVPESCTSGRSFVIKSNLESSAPVVQG